MHIAGINWVAVLVAAAVFFAIGYIIHMRLVEAREPAGVRLGGGGDAV